MFPKLGLLFALGASTLVSANPIALEAMGASSSTASAEASTPISTSTGFQLVADVTDPFNTLATHVQNMLLQAYHIGSNAHVAVLHKVDKHNPGRVFYLNKKPGTSSRSTILTDSGGSPAVSFGFSVPPPSAEEEKNVDLPVGNESGTPVSIGNLNTPYGGIFVVNDQGEFGGTFLACARKIRYYDNPPEITLEYAYRESNATGDEPAVPADCVPIRLVLQCADLPEVAPGSKATHQYAQTVPCYKAGQA